MKERYRINGREVTEKEFNKKLKKMFTDKGKKIPKIMTEKIKFPEESKLKMLPEHQKVADEGERLFDKIENESFSLKMFKEPVFKSLGKQLEKSSRKRHEELVRGTYVPKPLTL